jgi:hypothetical protein
MHNSKLCTETMMKFAVLAGLDIQKFFGTINEEENVKFFRMSPHSLEISFILLFK